MDKEKSPCCGAKIKTKGGGYEGKEIAPIKDICSNCEQVIRSNGRKQKVIDIKTGKVVQKFLEND